MIRPAAGGPPITWPTLIWVFIGAEVLLAVYYHMALMPVDVLLEGNQSSCEALYGAAGSGVGFVRVLLVVNLIAALGLWVAFRSARPFRGSLANALRTASLLGAIVLACIGWWGVRTQERCPRLEVVAIWELGSDGAHRLTHGSMEGR